ncbi:hypothetical protein [Rheinheimera sp.]|uniref:hypothetical protein n=1 Tax=Rheinheimera sp. TaxID=1869214 RepID=UPI0027B92A6C|nr:hypothetical protein [Rheinheimera sp.]
MKTFNTALLVTTLMFGSFNTFAAEPATELSSQLTQVLSTQVMEVSNNIQQQIAASIEATVAEMVISVEDTLSQAPAQNNTAEQSVAAVE